MVDDMVGEELDDIPLSHSELKLRALRDFRKSKQAALEVSADRGAGGTGGPGTPLGTVSESKGRK